MKTLHRNIIGIMSVLVAAIIAIAVHALLPSPGATLDISEFDGILVQLFGFPIVASIYFVILYLHILWVIRYFAPKSYWGNRGIGIRYGLAFGLMYLVGMQEVVVSASPCDTYGLGFVVYQFFIGLGDAIPVMVLCLLVSAVEKKKSDIINIFIKKNIRKNIVLVFGVAITFFIERAIGYVAGYLDSDIREYPVPVLVWTFIFGVVLGGMYLILRPIYNQENKTKKVFYIVLFTIGINWIWFNCFMGLILDGLFVKMFFRSLLDVLFVMIACLWWERRFS